MEKTEVQKSGEASQSTSPGETVVPSAPSIDGQMQEALKVLSEETLQLSEFLWQEEKLVKELCTLLKLVLKRLGLSFNLPPSLFPQSEKIQKIILNDETHLILINDQNEVRSRALEDYPPQVIFDVVSFVIPELGRSLTFYRKKINVRIGLFERVNQELRKIRSIFENNQKKLEEGTGPVDDGVKKALSAPQDDPNKK